MWRTLPTVRVWMEKKNDNVAELFDFLMERF